MYNEVCMYVYINFLLAVTTLSFTADFVTTLSFTADFEVSDIIPFALSLRY